MIIDLQKRIQEAGRIRIGQQVPAGGSKTRPEKLTTFRLTSPDRHRIEQAAARYGGTVAEWEAPSGKQWEVVTETDALEVIVPPSEMSFSQHYELWAAGGCQRRCDGVTESIGDRPCVCDPDQRECSIHTRLSVMLRDLSGLGVWRIDTSGWYAAVELGGAVQVVQSAAGRGALLPARLRLEQRSVKRFDADGKSQTRRFAVPVLDVEVTPAELLGGSAPAQVAEASSSSAPLTPVPQDLPSGPQRSIAEQSQAPPERPKRKNSAPEIPASGRQRRSEPPSAPEPEPAEQADDDGMITRAQQNKIGALMKDADITSREEALSFVNKVIGREVESRKELSKDEASQVVDALEALVQDIAEMAQAADDEAATDEASAEAQT